MFKLIQAKEQHLDQLVNLIASTGYFEAIAKYNLLGICASKFIREYIAKPALPITTVAVSNRDDNEVLGMISCATKDDILKLPNYGCYREPRLTEMLKSLVEFEITDSFHVKEIAVCKEMRGKNIGKSLFQLAEKKAAENGQDNISLYVWNCQRQAIQFYLNMKMMITKSISVSEKFPYSMLLYFEKKLNTIQYENYFETDEYYSLNLLK